MKLLKFELKKLLFNKPKLALLFILFLGYTALAFLLTLGEFEMDKSSSSLEAIAQYKRKNNDVTGVLNDEQYEISKEEARRAREEFGEGEPLYFQSNRSPTLRFHLNYDKFGERVLEYRANLEELQTKVNSLDENSYEYRLSEKQMKIEEKQGEPQYAYTRYWDTYFLAFDGIFVVFFFLLVLTFYVSPLFTQEVRTEMDSIILCSKNGRHEIVTAKLLSVVITMMILACVYLLGFFMGAILLRGDFTGINVPITSLSGFENSPLNLTVGTTVLLSFIWLNFVAVVFGLFLSLISGLFKNQTTAFGVGIVVLIGGAMSSYFGGHLRQFLWSMMDFNFGSIAMFYSIFGNEKFYNFFGFPLSYSTAIVIVGLLIGIGVSLLIYRLQKKREVR